MEDWKEKIGELQEGLHLERVYQVFKDSPWYKAIAIESAASLVCTILSHYDIIPAHFMSLTFVWFLFLLCRTLFVTFVVGILKNDITFKDYIETIVYFTTICTLYFEARTYLHCPCICVNSEEEDCMPYCFARQSVFAVVVNGMAGFLCYGIFRVVKMKVN